MSSADRLLAYLDDELSPEERRAIEAEIARDDTLHIELEQLAAAREAAAGWFAEPAPGIGKVAKLQIPRVARLHPATRLQRIQRVTWRAAAMAAVFVVGFAIGQTRQTPAPQPATPSQSQQVATPVPAALPGEMQLPPADEERQPAPRYALDEQGRMLVHTVSPSTGARATWIVDGSFQLAQSVTKGDEL